MFENERKKYIRFVITYLTAMMIPMVIITLCVMALFKKQQLNKIDDEVQLMQMRQADFLSQQLSVIRIFSQRCKYDSKYNELYSNRPGSYIDISRELSRQEQIFPFAEAVYLYDDEQQILLSSDGIITEDLFFSEICRVEEDIFNGLEEGVIAACPAFLRSDSGQGVVFVTAIRTLGSSGSQDKYLLFTVKNSEMDVQFRGAMEGSISIVFLNDRVIYATEAWDQEENREEICERLTGSGDYFVRSGDLGYGFSISLLIPRERLGEAVSIYTKGYVLWLIFSLILGTVMANIFSKGHYENYLEILINNRKLLGERDSLQEQSKANDFTIEKLTENVEELRQLYEEAKKQLMDLSLKESSYSKKVTLEETKVSRYKKRNIVDILNFLHEHYLEDNFSVNYMADYFDTSVSNISHFFKKSMGITISQYIEQIKLERAKEMLENSNKSVSEIAGILRYAGSTVFIGMFKKYEKMTPGGYREKVRNERKTEKHP